MQWKELMPFPRLTGLIMSRQGSQGRDPRLRQIGGSSAQRHFLERLPEMVRLASQHCLRCTVEERIMVPCLTHPQPAQDTSSEHLFSNLEDAGLVELVPSKEVEGEDGKVQLYSGRVITAAGQKLLDQVAHSVREQANEEYPGLDKY